MLISASWFLLKLTNQTAKTTQKNKLIILSIEIKKEGCYVLIFKKRHMKEEKDIAPKDFAEYLSLSKWKVLLY